MPWGWRNILALCAGGLSRLGARTLGSVLGPAARIFPRFEPIAGAWGARFFVQHIYNALEIMTLWIVLAFSPRV